MAVNSENVFEDDWIRLLIVDDRPSISAAFHWLADETSDILIVGDVGRSETTLDAVAELHPDVVVLDIRMGGTSDGVDLARELKERFPDIGILVYSAYDPLPYVNRLRAIGVDGYLLKTEPMESVLDAVRSVAKGTVVYSERIRTRLEEISAANSVTITEMEALHLLAVGLPNAEIAQALSISKSGVDRRLDSLFGKLSVRNRTEAVVKAARLGMIVFDDIYVKPYEKSDE